MFKFHHLYFGCFIFTFLMLLGLGRSAPQYSSSNGGYGNVDLTNGGGGGGGDDSGGSSSGGGGSLNIKCEKSSSSTSSSSSGGYGGYGGGGGGGDDSNHLTFICSPPSPDLITLKSEHVLWLEGPKSSSQTIDLEIPNYKLNELIKTGFKYSDTAAKTQINLLLKKPSEYVGAIIQDLPKFNPDASVNLQYEAIGPKHTVHFPNDKPYSTGTIDQPPPPIQPPSYNPNPNPPPPNRYGRQTYNPHHHHNHINPYNSNYNYPNQPLLQH